VNKNHLSVLKLQREDEPAHFSDPVAANKILRVLEKNCSLVDVQGISQNPELKRILTRNRIMKEKVRKICLMLLLGRKFDSTCLFSHWPKEVVLLLAQNLYQTRGQFVWL
jgi:hypothetical protein